MEEKVGKNGGEQTMGRRVGGRRLIRVGRSMTEVSMIQRKETKGAQSSLVLSTNRHSTGYVFIELLFACFAISSKKRKRVEV